jgi:ATP-dependent Clp protease ATP-binding subunit ClpA
MAEEGLDPVVGREKKSNACSQILSRKKNNPLLIGNLRKISYC